MEQIKDLPLPTPTFNTGVYETVEENATLKRRFFATPEMLEDEYEPEYYDGLIEQDYQFIAQRLQIIANRRAQRDVVAEYRRKNPQINDYPISGYDLPADDGSAIVDGITNDNEETNENGPANSITDA